MFNYPTTFTRDGDTILVTFRDVPEAITFGANKEEALLNAVKSKICCKFSLAMTVFQPVRATIF
jgi:hypothetical protein